jgi:hypothetical protein
MSETKDCSKSNIVVKLGELDNNLEILRVHLNTIYGMLESFMKPDLQGGGFSGSVSVPEDNTSGIYSDLMKKNMKVVLMSIMAKSIIDRAEL